MFKLKDIIFDLFGRRDWVKDIFKNAEGKGLHQRFQELLADDLDDNEIALINNLVENTQNPKICFHKFIPYHEQQFGFPVISSNIEIRRKFMLLKKELNRVKTTKLGYLYMFRILGFADCVIDEIEPVYGFDSPGTFDDPVRVFDQKCKGCSKYIVNLFGTLPITAELVQSILEVIKYNEPIFADLQSITYNGDPLLSGVAITMFVDVNGDLVYTNPYDSSFSAYINSDGDLIIESDFASFYSLEDDGDLIFTT